MAQLFSLGGIERYENIPTSFTLRALLRICLLVSLYLVYVGRFAASWQIFGRGSYCPALFADLVAAVATVLGHRSFAI